jgi:phosphatidate cytidylyltransferase
MFFQRLLVAVVLLPVGLWALFSSQIAFGIFMSIVLLVALWEYVRMFRAGGYSPAGIALYAALISFFFAIIYLQEPAPLILVVFFTLVIAGWHLWEYERGRSTAVLDMTISLFGMVYIGVLGSFFISLRGIPGGAWWLLIVLTSVWWADVGAYAWGSLLGKRPLAPRLSPKKTWEGYLGGVITTLVGSPLLLKIFQITGLPVDDTITYARVMVIAVLMGFFPTLGDLTISMLKRYFGLKDSGRILLEHGGMLDRVDSWLWAVSIGFFLIVEKFIK